MNPVKTLAVFKQIQKAAGLQSFRIAGVEDLKPQAVVAHQSAERGKPEKPVAGLQN